MPSVAHSMQTFRLLVANTLIATVTNNFIWFALTFWVYLETRSVMATAIIGGGYMLLFAVSGMFFGTFVDRHPRKTSMLLSSGLSLGGLRARQRRVPGGTRRIAAGSRSPRVLGPGHAGPGRRHRRQSARRRAVDHA